MGSNWDPRDYLMIKGVSTFVNVVMYPSATERHGVAIWGLLPQPSSIVMMWCTGRNMESVLILSLPSTESTQLIPYS